MTNFKKKNKIMYKLTKFSTNRSIKEAKEIYKQRIVDALEIHNKHKENFVSRSCFICGENDFAKLTKFHDTYQVIKCNVCASESVNPIPNEDALKDYYNNGKCNILLNKILENRHNSKSNFIMEDRVKVVLDLIGKIEKNEINILEIGCSSGAFLSKLKYFIAECFPDKKIYLAGIDIDANAIKRKLDKDLELTVANAETYVKLASGRYDIVLHFELIEHLADPYEFMRSLYRLLISDGIMFFSTPNANGLEMIAAGYNDFRPLAHSIFPPMHLNAFSVTNISHFAIRSGFKVLEISTPGKLDIDMLSIFENEMVEILKKVSELDDNTKGLLQYLITYMQASSHMRCILRKKQN